MEICEKTCLIISLIFLLFIPIQGQSQPDPNAVTCSWESINSSVICNGLVFQYESRDEIASSRWFADLFIVVFLILFAGLSSGLTMGLLGLDYTTLEVLSKSGTPNQQVNARKILPLVNRHHLLLVTMLLATSGAEEALPLFLERMMPAWASILVSVTLVLIFGEVLPMAICTRYGLDIGGKLAWLVWIFVVVTTPVAYPISKILDWMFGHTGGTLFKRSQLKELIDLHSKHVIRSAEDVEAELQKLPEEDRLNKHEVQLIKNALDLNSRTVLEISTTIDDVYMLELNQFCDREVIGSIVHFGLHFRVPVYRENRDNIQGVIKVGDLISLSPDDEIRISDLELDPIPKIFADMPVYKALTLFQSTNTQVAIVVNASNTRIPISLLTIEDIVEELVQGQLTDMEIFSRPDSPGDNVLENWMENPNEHDTESVGTVQSAITTNSNLFTKNMIVSKSPTSPAYSLNSNPSSLSLSSKPPFLSSGSFHPWASSSSLIAAKRSKLVPYNHDDYYQQHEQNNSNIPSDEFHITRPSTPGSVATEPGRITEVNFSNDGAPSIALNNSNMSLPVPAMARVSSQFLTFGIPNTSNPTNSNTSSSTYGVNSANKDRKFMKDSAANLIAEQKKASVVNAVAVALKKSSSNVSVASNAKLAPIYRRNHDGHAVVDPSKLLSASHGDITDTVPDPLMEPSYVQLSASHDAFKKDEEMVHLDI